MKSSLWNHKRKCFARTSDRELVRDLVEKKIERVSLECKKCNKIFKMKKSLKKHNRIFCKLNDIKAL